MTMSSAEMRLNDLPLVFAKGTDTLRAEFVARLGNVQRRTGCPAGQHRDGAAKIGKGKFLDLSALVEV